MNLPFLSVIIPTYRREEALVDSIKDVLKQEYPKFELIVVDQTAEHQPEVQSYLESTANNKQIKWLRVNWASLPGARNYGVRHAQGEIVLFIDDDVQLPEGYLLAHAQNYLENPQIGGVAGRVLDRMKQGDAERGAEGYSTELKETLAPEASDPGIAWYYLDFVYLVKPQPIITARGCNMSFRKDIFTEYGVWFDERFRGSAVREESDFCLRLRATGYEIWYDPTAKLVHLGEETGGCHDISTKSLSYQLAFYHNHFLMALKNLTCGQQLRLYAKLFDCHVLGNPPCNKSGSPLKILTRGIFYFMGLFDALKTIIVGLWDSGQIYTRLSLKQ
jgi:glycosyltransferase involved in cell wall biosynthesis